MEIKQSRSTRLANSLLNHLENSKRSFDGTIASMISNEMSYFSDGYTLYQKHNDRRVNFYGHINFDKVLIQFESDKFKYETTDLNEARELIISYLFIDENNNTLNKILKTN